MERNASKRHLQSLTRAERIDGDGVVVQASNDGKKEGQGDASQEKKPAGGGTPSHGRVHVVRDAKVNEGAEAGGLRVNKLVARTWKKS